MPNATLEDIRESFSRQERALQRLGASIGVARGLLAAVVRSPRSAIRLARELAVAGRSGLFDRDFYAWAHPEVMARHFSSPLLHYCTEGWRKGWGFAPDIPPIPPDLLPPRGNPLVAHARLFPGRRPTADTLRRLWRELRPDRWEETVRGRLSAEAAPKPPLAVVIPYYNHPEFLPALSESLLEHTPPDVLLIFVENGSEDPAVRPALLQLMSENSGRVQVECLDENIGFAGACNHGMRSAAGYDVILLNSDTVVGPRWSDSLRLAAYADARIGTATAISDNAWFASVPEEGPNPMPPGLTVAETARGWLHAQEFAFDQHTGHGFCLYLRRDMLDDVGLLDVKRFGKGYGEELDLCLRAWERGWSHRVTTRAFVRHLEGGTFDPAYRNARIEASSRDLDALHPDFGKLKLLHRPLWAARRPALRLVDRGIRAFDAPKPLPRALMLSSGAAPIGFEAVRATADPWAWAPLGLTHDDLVVSQVIECGAEAVVADEAAIQPDSPLAARLTALHIPVLRPGFVPPAPVSEQSAAPPKVSVIVPVFNVSKFLPRCLDALLTQTLCDIQIVCIDDGSTDGSAGILRRYAERDERIVALFGGNHGAEWARSIAMEHATGKYLMFCDADDEYAPEMCATMAGAMDRLGVDLVICSARHEGDFTEAERRNRRRTDIEHAPVEIRGRDDVLWNKIFRRDLVERSGLRFPRDPGIRFGFDAVFCFCYQLVARDAATLSARLYTYRRRKGSLVNLRRRSEIDASLDFVRALPGVFAFAETNHLPPAKRATIAPWCEETVAESILSMTASSRGEGIRMLQDLFAPKASDIGPATPLIRALACRDETALRTVLTAVAERRAARVPARQSSPFHAGAAAFARRLPILGPHLRAVDACLVELRRLQDERRAIANERNVFRDHTLRAEATLRTILLQEVGGIGNGTTGRGPDVPGAVVVSFTSFPARIRRAAAAAASLLRQDVKPDAVVLWLDPDQFPRRDADLPPDFDGLRAGGLDIRWCRPGLRSYKKLVPALEAWPGATIVTADDDVFYPRDWLARLLSIHRDHPGEIVAHRTRRIRFDRSGAPLPYSVWPINDAKGDNPTLLYLSTGCGGVLYPPGSLHRDVTDEQTFLRVAPTADDLWFWAMAVRQGTPVRLIGSSDIQSLDTEDEIGPGSLNRTNNAGGGNDRQLRAILLEYPRLLDGIILPTS